MILDIPHTKNEQASKIYERFRTTDVQFSFIINMSWDVVSLSQIKTNIFAVLQQFSPVFIVNFARPWWWNGKGL